MIEQDIYDVIIKRVPIVCVDVVIMFENKILFVKRNSEPLKDIFWYPGGRLYKNESFSDCAIRKSKEETGLDCTITKFLCADETIFKTGPNNIPVHSVNFIFLMASQLDKVVLDSTSSEYVWIENIPENFNKVEMHPHISESLKLI